MPITDPISKLLNAVNNPDYYNLEITVGMFSQFDEDSREVLSDKLISEDGKVYLPLLKKYSLSVNEEIQLDLSKIDRTPTDNLIKLIGQIAEAENSSIDKVESIVKQLFDNELDMKILPVSWICYYEVLANAYYEVMFGAKNQKLIIDVLKDRGIKLNKNTKIPMLFLRELNTKFLVQERNGWIEETEDEFTSEESGKLRGDLEALKTQIQSLTGTVSGLTSRIGELEAVDIKAIKDS